VKFEGDFNKSMVLRRLSRKVREEQPPDEHEGLNDEHMPGNRGVA